MGKGWTSVGLPAVGDDETLWTVAEAALLLGPPVLPVTRVRQLVALAGLSPVGRRKVSLPRAPGRYARVYRAVDLIEAYDRLAGVRGADG